MPVVWLFEGKLLSYSKRVFPFRACFPHLLQKASLNHLSVAPKILSVCHASGKSGLSVCVINSGKVKVKSGVLVKYFKYTLLINAFKRKWPLLATCGTLSLVAQVMSLTSLERIHEKRIERTFGKAIDHFCKFFSYSKANLNDIHIYVKASQKLHKKSRAEPRC